MRRILETRADSVRIHLASSTRGSTNICGRWENLWPRSAMSAVTTNGDRHRDRQLRESWLRTFPLGRMC